MIPGPPHGVPGMSGDNGDGLPSGPSVHRQLPVTPTGKFTHYLVHSIRNKF